MIFTTKITTKADAMAFAIEQAAGDLEKAEAIYRMFTQNMTLPDTEGAAKEECLKSLSETAEALREKIEAWSSPKSEAVKVEKIEPCTIILPGMPHLEWMTENISGLGGTEINGETYYTYDEAVEAVKQLGDGWRLPTRGEMVDLDDLGSTWDDERKGRWFGGNHDTDHVGSLFIPASGYRTYTTGALSNVGARGLCWSSSPAASGSTVAGDVYFNASTVYPMNSDNRSYGFTVRCVRNRQ